ncbi:MAG: glycosyltransferase family 2 protein [Pseudomonadota bacterium]
MIDDDRPEISVIMPAWKSADFISASIASVQAQKDIRWEMIVVEDASPDHTGEVVKAIAAADPRIRLETFPENRGPAAARNRAIQLSRAPFVAVLDDDDAMDPMRLRTLVDIAETESADIVVDNMLEVEDAPGGAALGRFLNLPEDGSVHKVSLREYMDPRDEDRFGASLGYLKPLFRRSALRMGYDETLRNSEDFFFVAHLLAQGASMVLTPQALYYYTRRQGSLSWRLSAENAASIVGACEAFVRRYEAGFTPDEKQASKRMLRQRRDNRNFAMLVEAIKSRHLGRALAALVRAPQSVPFMTSEFLRIAGQKLKTSTRPAAL